MMSNRDPSLEELKQIVLQTVEEQPLLRKSDINIRVKADGSYVTEVDAAMQAGIQKALASRWPQYGFIGEEMSHAEQLAVCQQDLAGYWVLDPLDGTTNFTAGFLFYGVSLALVVNGESHLAVVYDPVRKECFSAKKGGGAFLNDTPLKSATQVALTDCIANVDYKRLVTDLAERLVRSPPYRSQRNLGASVLEWSWLACGRVQLYLHGGQKLWDFAAGYLILTESGGAATSLSGTPLDCTRLSKRSVVAASNPILLEKWTQWIRDNMGDAHGV